MVFRLVCGDLNDPFQTSIEFLLVFGDFDGCSVSKIDFFSPHSKYHLGHVLVHDTITKKQPLFNMFLQTAQYAKRSVGNIFFLI